MNLKTITLLLLVVQTVTSGQTIGDSLAKVETNLGKPLTTLSINDRRIHTYSNGTKVLFVNSVVVSVEHVVSKVPVPKDSDIYADSKIAGKFTIPDTNIDFEITIPRVFTQPSSEKEMENKRQVLKALSNKGVQNVNIVELFQTTWESSNPNPPLIMVATNPSLAPNQGRFSTELWSNTKTLYQKMASDAFEKIKKRGDLNTKNEVDIFFKDNDDMHSFTILIEDKAGQLGYSVHQMYFRKGCIFSVVILAPPPADKQLVKSILTAIDIK